MIDTDELEIVLGSVTKDDEVELVPDNVIENMEVEMVSRDVDDDDEVGLMPELGPVINELLLTVKDAEALCTLLVVELEDEGKVVAEEDNNEGVEEKEEEG